MELTKGLTKELTKELIDEKSCIQPSQSLCFLYGEKELAYLRSKDEKLAEAIDKIGKIERKTTPDLFTALIHTIVGQQISVKAQATIWQRILDALTETASHTAGMNPVKTVRIDAHTVANYDSNELQKLGLSHRKVSYMQDIAQKIVNNEFDLDVLYEMTDDEVKAELSKFKGIGGWSAEMLMIFSMQRPNVLSFGDLAILRGLRMLHHHKEITPKLFVKYQRRYAPYASVASLYLWAIAGGAIPEMRDYQVKKTAIKKPTTTPKNDIAKDNKPVSSINHKQYIGFYKTVLGTLEIHADDEHINHVQFIDDHENSEYKKDSLFPNPNHLTEQAITQINEYLTGTRTAFDLPIQQQGTDFQTHVWEALSEIPYGSTVSYKYIAEQVGNVKASRAVGMANNKNRVAIIVPCHRVIGSNGSLVGYAGGLDTKRKLLALEKLNNQ